MRNEMTHNESRARKIIYKATETGMDIPSAIYHIIGKNELPKLTDRECEDIAINYPISLKDIRIIFPRSNNNY